MHKISKFWLMGALCFAAGSTMAQGMPEMLHGWQHDRTPSIELSAEGSSSAANDMAVATAYVELSDGSASQLAKRINQLIASALQTAKQYPSIKAQSAGIQTYPNYNKGGTRIDSWRMRSSLRLESKDVTALSELIGKLQTSLAIESIQLMPTPETQRKAEDAATVAAIEAFEARAELAAKTLGKHYRIKQLTIGNNGYRPVMYQDTMARKSLAMEAAPAPLEGGESQIHVNVQGRIELLD